MKKTTFKEVAHLYLGCKIQTKEGVGTFNSLHDSGPEPIGSHDLVHAHLDYHEVKPVLRRLETITEEEMEAYHAIEDRANILGNPDREIQSRAYSPVSLVYLLSRRFDLFGLIDSGEAVNADSLSWESKTNENDN